MFTLLDTETDTETDKNGLYRLVWRCFYLTETDIKTNSHGFFGNLSVSISVSVYVSVSVSGSVHSPQGTSQTVENYHGNSGPFGPF